MLTLGGSPKARWCRFGARWSGLGPVSHFLHRLLRSQQAPSNAIVLGGEYLFTCSFAAACQLTHVCMQPMKAE